MKKQFAPIKINILFLLNVFLYLQVFKYPLMVFVDRFLINLISILFLVPPCLFLFTKRFSYLIKSKIFFVFLVLIFHFFISIFLFSNNLMLAIKTNIQLLLPIFFILIVSLISNKNLVALIYKTRIIFFILFFSAIVELLLPPDLIYEYRRLLYDSRDELTRNIPLNEFLNFNIRMSSIISEPLLSAHLILLLYVINRNKLSSFIQYLTQFLVILHGVLSASGTLIFMYIGVIFRRLSFYLFIFFVVLFIVFVSYYYEFFLEINFFDNFKSTSAHLVGLVNGFNSSINNILFGNGSGAAGSIVTNSDLFRETNSNFISLQLGNESTFGVLFYQFGLILPLLLLCYFISLSYQFYRKKDYEISGLIFGYIFYMFFSESFLTIPNQIFFYLLLFYRYQVLHRRTF